MVERMRIEPDAVYDDGALVGSLGVTHRTLSRARRKGHLRFTRKGTRVLYLGEWVLDWLAERAAAGTAKPESKVAPC